MILKDKLLNYNVFIEDTQPSKCNEKYFFLRSDLNRHTHHILLFV